MAIVTRIEFNELLVLLYELEQFKLMKVELSGT